MTRMPHPRIAVVAVAWGFLLATPCSANSANEEFEAASRPAGQADLIGEWHMIYQVVSPKISQESLFFARYQAWKFSEDGYVKNVASTKPLDDMLPVLLDTMPKTATFRFRKEGFLELQRQEQDGDAIAVSIMTRDMKTPLRPSAPLLRQGDLVLSYLRSPNVPYMQRFLRRGLPPPSETRAVE